ncbi:DUF6427 family protein [Flavobacterium rhizosphaerae]|uniref:DUF6427 family protein n=1 Tax=Flavobacterium rhizosphaerae TaxID=3163298 RepID=A0ABW8Z159_9FLAO
MLASIFGKSRPINYVIIGGLLLLCYVLYIISGQPTGGLLQISLFTGLFLLLAASLFLTGFITRKNNLSRQNTYALFFLLLFFIQFPTTFVNNNVIIANFLILLSLRRLVSLQSLITPKEKIFDASFWIFIATLFHFWCILFIVLVYISIIFHAAGDYRNWIIPLIALFAATMLYAMVGLMIGHDFLEHLRQGATVSFDFTYFESIYQNIALALFVPLALLFLVTYSISIAGKSLNLQPSHKKIMFAFITGVCIYVLSSGKNNSFLAFTFAPMAIMGANFIENQKIPWIRETSLLLITAIAFFIFIMQL